LYSEVGSNYIKRTFKLISHHWSPERSWTGVVEVPAGLEEEFMGHLNKISHGSVHIDELR
jgi:ribosome maturation protein Sdo1